MKSAEDRQRDDFADPLYGSEVRRIFVQGQMSPDSIVISGVCLEDAAQVGLAEHDGVIKALAPYRSDHTFSVAVLPRQAGRRRMIADTHRTNTVRAI
jgi:hypothetical protein